MLTLWLVKKKKCIVIHIENRERQIEEMNEDITKNFTRMEKLLWIALKTVCKLLRQNPMADLSRYPKQLIFALVGSDNDPDGEKYLQYFLNVAKEELEYEEWNEKS